MPSEYRRLVFSNEELCRALVSFARRRNEKLPPGDVTRITIDEAPRVSVTLHVLDPDQGTSADVPMQPAFVAGALIQFCQAERIPLPRRATKMLGKSGDNLCLIITIDEQKLLDLSRDQ